MQHRIKSALRRLLHLLLSWDREQGRVGQGQGGLSARSMGGLLMCSLKVINN